jgi:hypothetical protein
MDNRSAWVLVQAETKACRWIISQVLHPLRLLY